MMFLIGSAGTAFLTAFGEGAMLAASVYLASKGIKRRQGNTKQDEGKPKTSNSSMYLPQGNRATNTMNVLI